MLSVMKTHIDQLLGFCGSLECGFTYSVRLAYEGDHRAVGRFAGIDVEHAYGTAVWSLCVSYGFDYGVYNALVTAFAEIRNTFYQLFHSDNYSVCIFQIYK